MEIDYKKLAEVTSTLMMWKETLSKAELRKSQAENDIARAEREISNRKIEIDNIIREGGLRNANEG